MKVKIYFNIKKMLFSVMHKGKVIDHVDTFQLVNVRFHVNQNGRKRVLEQKKKNVHAYIIGTLTKDVSKQTFEREVVYNPLKHETFMAHVICTKTGIYKGTRPITNAEQVYGQVLNGKPLIVAGCNLTQEIIDELFYPLY